MVPVNLVHAIADVGFDFGMTEREVAEPCLQCHLVESAAIVRVQKARRCCGGRGSTTVPTSCCAAVFRVNYFCRSATIILAG